jgi:hypothetical protein
MNEVTWTSWWAPKVTVQYWIKKTDSTGLNDIVFSSHVMMRKKFFFFITLCNKQIDFCVYGYMCDLIYWINLECDAGIILMFQS